MRIGIAEDDKTQRDLLVELIDKFSEENNLVSEIILFEDGQDIVDYQNGKFDLLLLDIQMKHLDGMKTAEIIRETDEDVIIIFITNLSQYAIKGYSVNAMSYIIKPIHYEVLQETLKRVLVKIDEKKPKYLLVKNEQGLARIDHKNITYIEIRNRKLAIHTHHEIIHCYQPLKKIMAELGSQHFMRCHVAYLVNLNYVEKVKTSSAIVAGDEVFVSKHRKKSFVDAITNYKGDNL